MTRAVRTCEVCGITGTPTLRVQLVASVAAHKLCRPKAACSEDGCTEPARSRGMCVHHYNIARYREDPERHRVRARQWAADNPDRVKERNAARDKAASAAAARAWYRDNRARAIATAQNTRARKAGVTGELTPEGIAARFAYFGGNCWVCQGSAADSIDHVKPLGRGGPNLHSNIRPAHLGCNAARSWEGRRK